MFRRFTIGTIFITCLPLMASPQGTPLRRSIQSIMALQGERKFSEALGACNAAISFAGDAAATAPDQAMLFSACGSVFLATGDLEKSRKLLDDAVRLWESLLGAMHKQVAATTLDLATLHRRAGRFELASQYARRALRIYESAEEEPVALCQALTNLSAAEMMLGRYAEAESNLNQVLSRLARSGLEKGPEVAAAHGTLGTLYYRQGRYFDAERAFLRASEGGSGTDSARSLANLARVYMAIRRYDKAETASFQAVNRMSRIVGSDNAEVAAMIEIVAQVRAGQGRYGDAAVLLEQALDISRRASGQDRLYESSILNSIGMSHALEGRYDEAEANFRKAAAIQEDLGGDARREFSVTLHNLAVVCGKQGRESESLHFASRAFAVRESDLPDIDSTLLDIMLHKAKLLRKMHNKAEAAKLEETARQVRAERKNQDPQQWMVDFRELQRKK